MIQIKKTILTLVALLAVTTGAWAQGPWTSGDCTVTLSDDVMTVSGTGAMADYKDTNFTPWYGYTSDVKTIVIESGVTSIGNFNFSRFEKLESVSIPASVTSIGISALGECGTDATTALTVSFAEGSAPLTIGEVAFRYANLKSIDIPNRVTSIGEQAFYSCNNLESVSIPASVTSIGTGAFSGCGSMAEALTVSFAEGSTPLTISEGAFGDAKLISIDFPNRLTSIGNYAFSGCGYLESVSIPASVTSISDGAFSYCGKLANVYIYAPSLTTYGIMAFDGNAAGRKIYVLTDAVDTYKAGWSAYAADIVGDLQPLASGPEVAWDKTSKTGTFTQPAGNVTVSVDYYPQATADGAVTAATDAKATTDAPLVTVDATQLTGAAKMMYYASTESTAPDYDAQGWSDKVPTAEKFTEAGNVNVWYYPVGTDEGVGGATATYSDGDMNATALAVALLPEPTYNVEFAEGTNDDNEWTASPATDVKKGQTVTVTYTGTKKVIGVKAEKKAKAPASTQLDNTTTAWTAGSYAVPAGGLTYSDAISVSGDVTLTLTDGTTLTLNKGISLAEGASLTVEGNGTMNINGTDGNTSSTVGGNHGTLILTSGTLTATGGNGGNIGMSTDDSHGGNGGDAINGSVIVSGGTLTARGGNGGSVGEYCENCSGGNGGDAISGTLTINGGSTSVNDGSNGSIGNFCGDCTAGAGGKAVAGTVTDNR